MLSPELLLTMGIGVLWFHRGTQMAVYVQRAGAGGQLQPHRRCLLKAPVLGT